MASLCWFYSMRPKDFYELTMRETAELRLYMAQALKER